MTIASEDLPDPRCIPVTNSQYLRIKNGTDVAARIQLRQWDMTLPAGEIRILDLPCGDDPDPKVRHATVGRDRS